MPKIIRFREFGGPEKLQLEELPAQQAAAGEVKLRVQATGLNRSEALYMRGAYSEKPKLPSRIGFEAAGTVVSVGSGVDTGLVGKQVSTIGGFLQSQYGVLGEEAIIPVAAVIEYPANFSPAQGAALWISYLTAWGALIHHARVAACDFVLIPAASSSVGLAAIQIAKDAGAVTIAATRKAEKRAELLALGADHVIATEEENLPTRVLEISGGRGSRIIFDPVGGPYVEALAEAASPGATIFLYGGLSGQATVYPIAAGLAKGLSLRGYSITEVRSKPVLLSEAQLYIRARLQDNRFVPKIAKTFSLEQSGDAYRFLESNNQVGKVVITV